MGSKNYFRIKNHKKHRTVDLQIFIPPQHILTLALHYMEIVVTVKKKKDYRMNNSLTIKDHIVDVCCYQPDVIAYLIPPS
jgi:hypothetical protein